MLLIIEGCYAIVKLCFTVFFQQVMEGICWNKELLDINFQDEDEFVKVMDNVTKLEEPAAVLSLVSTWKEGGDLFFNKGQFGLANAKYDMAAKYLTYTLLVSTIEFDPCKELAVALLLNLTTCALKLGLFQRAFDVCSLVINIQSDSTKAWFGRAKAYFGNGFDNYSVWRLKKNSKFGSL